MKGYPKHLNTKHDYEYVRKSFPKRKWEKDFQALLESEKAWQVTKTLSKEENGVEDKTHKVFEAEDTRVQMELKVDPNSRTKQLGYSKKDLKTILEKR
jgi:predicted SAM-dependent methyltransferase